MCLMPSLSATEIETDSQREREREREGERRERCCWKDLEIKPQLERVCADSIHPLPAVTSALTTKPVSQAYWAFRAPGRGTEGRRDCPSLALLFAASKTGPGCQVKLPQGPACGGR
ncbi:hypothetical protein AOLI_G00000800 [Acnodon oligacanthus]